MFPELLKIGRITIYSYGLMMALAIGSAFILVLYRGKKRGFNTDALTDIGFYGIIGGLAGSKLLYLITEAPDLIKNPGSIIGMMTSGFVVYGAILGGVTAGYIYCKIKKLNFLEHFDLVAPSLALAQGVGRIGCFLAGCCYGKRTDSFLGVIFNHSAYAPAGVKILPTQIFSSIGDFSICIILLLFAKKERLEGRVAGLYMILYSSGRFLIEFLRDDPRGTIGFLSTSQFICIFILLGGIIMVTNGKIKALASHN